MPRRADIAYFGAGPAGVPSEVIIEASNAFINFENTGLGLAEISHRSATASKILADLQQAIRDLLQVPENYEIMFCHGGGSGQFSATVLNLVPVWIEKRRRAAQQELGSNASEEAIVERVKKEIRENLRLDYLVTGSWSLKASQEAAQLLGPLGGKKLINVAVDSRESNNGKFVDIPQESEWKLTNPQTNGGLQSAFTYYCANETVDGIEIGEFPKILESGSGEEERIVVSDMSSNIMSRPVDVSKFGVIYAGAQKNIGITDTTILIVRKDLLTDVPPASFLHAVGFWSAPTIMSWPTINKANSLYNTMPIFSLYTALLVLRRTLTRHANLLAIDHVNDPNPPTALALQAKESASHANRIYSIIKNHPSTYTAVAKPTYRSRMNICFRVRGGDEAVEKRFLQGAEAKGLLGLKGHRSVGGVRVSNYNVVSQEDVNRLSEYMLEFAEEFEPKEKGQQNAEAKEKEKEAVEGK